MNHWNVEDEGPVSDLLNVDIVASDDCVRLSQQNYIQYLVDTYLPDGIPPSFKASHAPATEDLPKHVDAALLTKTERSINSDVH
eukprot:4178685-Pleurochrysis_carterae.AAC.1